MKGIIFTEFLAMVEETFSMDMVDTIIEKSELKSGGAYTAIGTYSHQEMNTLVTQLSKETGMPIPDLLKAFGTYLFKTLSKNYPAFLVSAKSVLDFLSSIENYIHVEVRKLYPDAELPRFKSNNLNEHTLELIYASERHYGDLAEGLILGAIEFFKNGELVEKTVLPDQSVKFIVRINE